MAMQGGIEQQIPPQATVIMLGFPSLSYVPTTHTGVGNTRVFAPIDFFMARIPPFFFFPPSLFSLLPRRGGRIDSLVGRLPEPSDQIAVQFAGVPARPRRHFRREKVHDDAVLVRRPHRPVPPQKGGAGAFLPAEAQRSIVKPRNKPLEPHGHLDQAAAEAGGHAVDHAAAHHGLAHSRPFRPLRSMGKQVRHGRGEVMVRIHEAGAARNDAVPVVVGVVRERDVEAVLEGDELRHRVRRGAVHPDLPVPVHRHEPECRVHLVVHDLHVEAVPPGDRTPVGHPRPSQGIDSQPQAGHADRLHVEDGTQVVDVGTDVVVEMRRRGGAGPPDPHPPPPPPTPPPFTPAARSAFAFSSIPRVASVSAGPPCGGLYLKPPSSGGLCDGVITIPSASPVSLFRLWTRIAWETTGVGVYPPPRSIITSTPLAASTSRAVPNAGSESAWVSIPRNRGPVMCRRLRYRQIAWVMARIWASLNPHRREEPRWPDVPKETRCSRTAGSGRSV